MDSSEGPLQFEMTNWFQLTTFYSDQFRDAVADEERDAIIRFDRTGYHRTIQESQTKNRLHEKSTGIIISLPLSNNITIGAGYLKTYYFPGFGSVTDETRRRDYFRFYGTEISNFSLSYTFKTERLLLKGEVIPLRRSPPAYQHSLHIGGSESNFFIRFSYLPAAFNSPHGRHLADKQPFPRNVQYFLIGYSGRPVADLKYSLYWSLEKDLWRTYFNPLPLRKKSAEFNLYYKPTRGTEFSIRYYHTTSASYEADLTIDRHANKLRLQIDKTPSSHFRFRTRFEKVLISYSSVFQQKHGLNLFQDIRWQPGRLFSLSLRFGSFHSDDYDARIYEFENSIPGTFSNYPLYGFGNKIYVIVRVSPLPGIKFWLKYRQINFDGIEQIGSGYTMIEGPTRQDLQFQIECRY